MAPKIHTPVEGYTGEVAGVAFAKGVGETDDPIALSYFERRGYTIEAGKPAPKKAPGKSDPADDELAAADAK